MHLGGSRQTKRPQAKSRSRSRWSLPIAGLALFLCSLTLVVQANALPVDAHITETWYSYKQDLTYDFQANLQIGSIYPKSPVLARELLQLRMPTEPPTFRRVTVAKLTDSLILSLPYKFTADQEADIRVTYWVDGSVTVPNLWMRPYPFLERQVVEQRGSELILDQLQVEIPIKQLMAELATLTEQTKINQEQAEITVRPAFEVLVNGLREPISAALAPEITLNIRGSNYGIEIDEPRRFHDEKSFEVKVFVPATVEILGRSVSVNLLRQIGTTLAVLFATGTAAGLTIQWLRKRAQVTYDVKRLGAQLITASNFEVSYMMAIVDLQSIKELLHLQVQMERPIVQVGQTYYLADESTCYRFTEPEGEPEAEPEAEAEAQAEAEPEAEADRVDSPAEEQATDTSSPEPDPLLSEALLEAKEWLEAERQRDLRAQLEAEALRQAEAGEPVQEVASSAEPAPTSPEEPQEDEEPR